MLVGKKNVNHNIKTMEKQKSIVSKRKAIDTKCQFKKLLFCPGLSGSINNFEFSLKNFDNDVTMKSAINKTIELNFLIWPSDVVIWFILHSNRI